MALRLNDFCVDQDIPVTLMNTGQVGMITQWGDCNEYDDLIIKRNGTSLFSLTNYAFWSLIPTSKNFRVRPLLNGTTFTVVDND